MIELGPEGVTAADVVAVARDGASAHLSAEARAAMEETAAVVASLADSEEPAYGISTGFGSLAQTRIPAERRTELQRALIRSHAAGMGPPVEREVVRAMFFLRARSLAMGRSGARPLLAETMLAMLGAGLDPVVPEHGSLGASGDLAPLAHCALAMLGEGDVFGAGGEPLAAGPELARAGIEPPVLGPKEGLALINGTDGILGMLVLALADLRALLRHADLAGAASTEALLGTDRAFAADLIALRPQPGQADSAANLRRLLDGSPMVASHRTDDPRVQDAYSIRCTPQVHGAARDTVAHSERIAEAELGAAIDNPMVLPDGRVESCGNFHGAPVGFACDFLAIAAAEVGAISERRTDRLLDAEPLARAPALPRPGRRRRLGPDDRPVHAGRDGGREPAPRSSRLRRLAADERDAGGSRLDGLGSSTKAPAGGRQPAARPGGRTRVRRPRPRAAGAPRAGPRYRRRARVPACGGAGRGSGPLALA